MEKMDQIGVSLWGAFFGILTSYGVFGKTNHLALYSLLLVAQYLVIYLLQLLNK